MLPLVLIEPPEWWRPYPAGSVATEALPPQVTQWPDQERAPRGHRDQIRGSRAGRARCANPSARSTVAPDRRTRSSCLLACRTRNTAILDTGRSDPNDPASGVVGALGRDFDSSRCDASRRHCLCHRRFFARVQVVRGFSSRVRGDWTGQGIVDIVLVVKTLDEAEEASAGPATDHWRHRAVARALGACGVSNSSRDDSGWRAS